jgi:hypothetical protein
VWQHRGLHNKEVLSTIILVGSRLLVPTQKFAEHPVHHFECAKICRPTKCSAEREALWNGIFELDKLDPKRAYGSDFFRKYTVNQINIGWYMKLQALHTILK